MRLIEVAKKLGMTGQELRREIAQVDFGVKPTDREISDQLAQGLIRFLAAKHSIEVEMDSDSEESASDGDEDEEDPAVSEPETETAAEEEKVVEEVPPPVAVPAKRGSAGEKKVHVLRKISLEGMPDAPATVKGGSVKKLVKEEDEKRKRKERLQRGSQRRRAHAVQEQIKKKEGIIELQDSVSVKEFAEKTGVQVPDVISTLMKNGVMANINQSIDFDTAAIVAVELGVQVKRGETSASAEGLLSGNLQELLIEDNPDLLQVRPPIVTVMGHVDHGKTAILDAIRKTDVVSGEAGGITQSIGAYQIEHDGKKVTFLDTPGHEAFTAMRARGAQTTDIVVLVVAADEGVKPTTKEAIDHARDADVPILVALNKIDKEGADADRVLGELASEDLQPEEWGGKTPVVRCSAKTEQGITDLLDHVLILAEIAELKANPDRTAVATVIEGHLDSSLGPVASVVINAGTLHLGENFVCGTASGKVKSMMDAHGTRIENASPSAPVQVAGLSQVPESGDILQIVKDEQEAKKLVATIMEARESLQKRGLGDLITRISEGRLTVLKIVLKVDTQGSLEAVEEALGKLRAEGGISAKIIHGAVGGITEGDVMMAAASGGIVLGFNVPVSVHVERIASGHGVQVRLYDVIYELLDEVGGLLQGLVEPEESEIITGHLEVRGTFFQKRSEQIIGGKVTDGYLKRVPFRLLRDGEEVGAGRITSLKRVDKDIKEAKEGSECGMRIDCPVTIQEGDILEGFVRELKKKGE